MGKPQRRDELCGCMLPAEVSEYIVNLERFIEEQGLLENFLLWTGDMKVDKRVSPIKQKGQGNG
jgi:hypothetical protein